ncbi:MAG: CDP-glucose 4,6-dehydratase [Endomicrobiaceae bacterium]|nr:CDP-glucose 4,6-dehydratase [Endomicrobiaceae bacterium]MDD3923407.1 CDP-glucose 4,6-dehydratase [Endomicrobiaceae bacterium]
MFNNIYENKKVFITGVSGFKGSWLSLWLNSLGANVLGYSLKPDTNPSMFYELKIDNKIQNVFGNILDAEKLEKTMFDFQPDIVFHLAAQPLVRLSYSEPVLTYQTNVIGTLNVLESARKSKSVKAFVNITTDKCYENKEVARGYKEDEPMGGYDMYSSSKGCVEIMSSSYRRSFLQNGYAMATARAGNVIGGGDWSADRLIPDCIKSIIKSESINIRNPKATRPWQHVLEPLSGYLKLGQLLLEYGSKYAEGFNFGPKLTDILPVEKIAQLVVKNYGYGTINIEKKDNLHEANLLMLDIEKVHKVLDWTPTYNIYQSIEKTVLWYKQFYKGEDMLNFTLKQIKEFEENIKIEYTTNE